MKVQQKQQVFEWHENLLDPIPMSHPLQKEKLHTISSLKYLLTPKFEAAINLRTYFLRNERSFKKPFVGFFNETILCWALMVGLSTERKHFSVYHLSYLVSSSPNKVESICGDLYRSIKLREYLSFPRHSFLAVSSITEGEALENLIKFVVNNEYLLELRDLDAD